MRWELINRVSKENNFTPNNQFNLYAASVWNPYLEHFYTKGPNLRWGVKLGVSLRFETTLGSQLIINNDWSAQLDSIGGSLRFPTQNPSAQRIYFLPEKEGWSNIIDITGIRTGQVEARFSDGKAQEWATALSETIDTWYYNASMEFYMMDANKKVV